VGAMLLASACGTHSPAAGTDAPSVEQSDAPGAGDAASVDAAVAADAAIQVMTGVDRAGAFSSTEAAALKSTYGIEWTGVYIGGACSAGSGWTKSVLTMLNSGEGWLFMPIWVGQQAPSICGRDTLTATQGTTDGQATAAMMATFGWAPDLDIPVVLDLEAGTWTYSTTGSQAYAGAWRDAVRAAGYLAYIYSSTTAINALDTAGVTFDGAWPAVWDYTAFKDVAPSDLTSLDAYAGTTRAWQYAGNVTTAAAGGVDADVADLLLAPAPGGTNK
jgi:Domain of unknown function (DUF1906)